MRPVTATLHRSDRTWILPLAVAAGAGALVPLHPLAPLVMLGAIFSALIVAQGYRATTLALTCLFGLLAGYAFFGRGFAYLGVAPLYVGEAVLALALLALVAALPRGRISPVHVLLVVFMAWGAVRTFPYLQIHGIDAFRDAVAWGYAAFAIFLSLVLQHSHFRSLVRWYATAVPLLIIWIPVLAFAWFQFNHLFPTAPGTDVPIPFFKAGDMAVHLAGAAAFMLGGLYPHTAWRRLSEPFVWLFWFAGVAVASGVNRGGMLAVGFAAVVLLFFVRSFDRWILVVVTALLVVAVAVAADFEVPLERGRAVSVGQIVENVESVFGETERSGLSGTREWRETWWDDIIDYTIHGPYFWDGKGFGINLAADDGFQGDSDHRSPHNAHIQYLARGGVPALALWLALQATFAVLVGRSALRAARSGQRYWLGVHAWILAYWIAALVNMTFDVYVEGPQGGILFWSVFGAGLALAKITPTHTPPPPGEFFDDPSEPSDAPPSPGRHAPWRARQGRPHVDINQADLPDLARIVHIGPRRASLVANLRPFDSVDDLGRVSGISAARLASIRAQGVACARHGGYSPRRGRRSAGGAHVVGRSSRGRHRVRLCAGRTGARFPQRRCE